MQLTTMIHKNKFHKYFKDVKNIYINNDYTEHTFRPCFFNFIHSLNSDYKLTNEPKKEFGGRPDCKARRNEIRAGYIETKGLEINLDIKSKQIRKYIDEIDNLILTDYKRFILIRKKNVIFDVTLFNINDLRNDFYISNKKMNDFNTLISNFFDYKRKIKSSKELANELSKQAKELKKRASECLRIDLDNIKKHKEKVKTQTKPIKESCVCEPETSSIYKFHTIIKESIHDIKIDDSADAYAQTLIYGLLLAKDNHKNTLSIENISHHVPKSIPIIKEIFNNIFIDLTHEIRQIIDECIEILNVTNIDDVLSQKSMKENPDPFMYFYEDFLLSYDPKKRKSNGVYYTPQPIVSFIVNSVNQILKDDFSKKLGFADDSVTTLDPSTGTGTFLRETFCIALDEISKSDVSALRDNKIKNHILHNFYGFELLIASYVIAHLKLSAMLKRQGYVFDEKDRVQVYLTNTLSGENSHKKIYALSSVTKENEIVDEIKLNKKILVILGNPPYLSNSSNKSEYIMKLLEKEYTRTDGSNDSGYYKVNEDTSKRINAPHMGDDYVKFIRFAQCKIDESDDGVIGFVTNNGYIDNKSFYGMRQSLSDSFDRIYILNLHGDITKKEKCPDGSKDENVFDIRQGVAITLFVKNKKFSDKKVFYTDLYGMRKHKYDVLKTDTKNTINWTEIKPKSPRYLFVPVNYELSDEFNKFWGLKDIFKVSGSGLVTCKDALAIRYTKNDMINTLYEFTKMSIKTATERFNLGNDECNSKARLARNDVIMSGSTEKNIHKVLYRPLDVRFTYYTGKSRGFVGQPSRTVMQHMVKNNMSIVFQHGQNSREHHDIKELPQVSKWLTDWGSSYYDTSHVAPLYTYDANNNKTSNINESLIKALLKYHDADITSENIFYYVYACMYSTSYRTKYINSLLYEYPRIPFTKDHDMFKDIVKLGKKLTDLHLMNTTLDTHTKFKQEGCNIIKNVKYKNKRIYINEVQYFEQIDEDVWDFYMGGVKVLDVWLKNRKNRNINNDINCFLQVIEIIKQTIDIIKQVDKIILGPNNLVEFKNK